MPSSANSSYLPSFHQLSSTTTRPPFRTVFVGARNLYEIVLSSPTPDGLTTLRGIAQALIRLSDAVCGLGVGDDVGLRELEKFYARAECSHDVMDVDHQRRRPPSSQSLRTLLAWRRFVSL
jgi:hypothetical protein